MIALPEQARISKPKAKPKAKAKPREESASERIAASLPRLTCIRRGEFYYGPEVAALFQLSLQSMKDMIDSGDWCGRKAKGSWIITGDSIADWIEGKPAKAAKK